MGQRISTWWHGTMMRRVGEDEDNTPKWKKMPFQEAYREALMTMDLSVHAKTIITIRYMENVLDIQKKNSRTLRSYNLHRVTILLSGLLVPTLFSITNDVPNQAALFWITLVVSLSGSISNAWIEYFGIIKLHYSYLSTCNAMEAEGWHFAALSGPYRKYRRHDQCWRKFIYSIERIHSEGLSRYMMNSQPSNRTASGKELMKEAGVYNRRPRLLDENESKTSDEVNPDDFIIQVHPHQD